jgi:hypothetical protein
MTEGKSDRFCINCRLVRETEKAWLIDPDGENKVWVPKSQGEVYKREDGTWDLFAEEWLLKAKGLI